MTAVGRSREVQVPLYRASDIDALARIVGVDWEAVRAGRPGDPSPLRDIAGRRPPTRAQVVRRWIARYADRMGIELWASYDGRRDHWELDWETRDGTPTDADVAAAITADPMIAILQLCLHHGWAWGSRRNASVGWNRRQDGRPDAVRFVYRVLVLVRPGPKVLLERDHELTAITDVIAGARGGEPAVLLVEGPAGIGKTVLLERARRDAAAGGVGVLSARGSELESDFPFGIVGQLFEPLIHGLAVDVRDQVLAGAAGLAGPVVAGWPVRPATGDDRSLATSHGLFWLTTNLADRGPLLMAVDDLQWSDVSSLRFLLFLTRRLAGLPLSIILAVRAGEGSVDHGLLGELLSEPVVRTVRPAGLSSVGVTRLVARGLGADPDPLFAQACLTATGGTPFLVEELVSSLAADGIAPTAQAAAHIGVVAPATVAISTVRRIARLGPHPTQVAYAAAVLGARAGIRTVSKLVGLPVEAVAQAGDALARSGILRSGLQLEFVHPILLAAVYDDFPVSQRAIAHARAADVLAEDGADPDSIAAQQLLSLPCGRPEVIERLRTAAGLALARGAPENAAAYLTRALEEGGGLTVRVRLLTELATATRLTNLPQSVTNLQEAIALTTDPAPRARLIAELAQLLLYLGQWREGAALVDAALSELGGTDRQLSVLLESLACGYAAYDPAIVDRFDLSRARLNGAIKGRVPTARAPALLIAANNVSRGKDLHEVEGLLGFGLERHRLLEAESAFALVPQAFVALVFLENLDRADQLAEELLAAARPLGSMNGFLIAAVHRAFVWDRRGDLRRTEGELRAAVDGMRELGLLFGLPSVLWYTADALVERPELTDIASLAVELEIPHDLAATYSGAMLAEARGRLRARDGQLALAVEDLREAWAITEALGFRNPNLSNLRCELALLLADRDPHGARQLADEALRDARDVGFPRAIGVCLRTLGLLTGGEPGLSLLRQAVAVLERSPARLEFARSLVELGAALRRDRQVRAARDRLGVGLALAERCGATRLADRALAELRATGARPRRISQIGSDSLTPSELRIAEMAAGGMSNPQIGQTLFITRNTVETHLRHVYQKLGIRRREDIAQTLENPD